MTALASTSRSAPQTQDPPRRRGTLARRQAVWCYVFMAPAILGLLLFSLGPMIASLWLSFTSYDLLSSPEWVGTENYVNLAQDPLFRKSLSVTLIYGLVAVPCTMLIALVLAIMLNAKIPALPFFRSAYYLPSVISGVAVATLWKWMFNGEYGLINAGLARIGIAGPAWLTDEQWALRALIFMSLWGFGATMLIYLAGLQGVPKELYEAAQVDGASRIRQHLHITVPILSPVTFFNLIMGIIASLQVFAEPFVLTKGGPEQLHPAAVGVPLPERFPVPQDGLRLSHRLGHLRDHPRLHPAGLPVDAHVGALRGG